MKIIFCTVKKILNMLVDSRKNIALFANYIYGSLLQYSKQLPINNKTILFTLEDDRLYRDDDSSGRYAYLILNLFSNAGYSVYFYNKVNFKKFIYFGKYGRYIYSIKNLKIIDKIPERTENVIYAFDSAVQGMESHKWKQLIYVNYLKSVSCLFGNLISIPIFMHPLIYKNNVCVQVKSFRKNNRKMRIFFGGNINLPWYDNADLHKYGQMTRREGVRAVLRLGEDVCLRWNIPEFRTYLDQSDYIKRCILLKTDHTLAIKSKEWMDIVSRSDFFLCLSGTDLPMCHNSVESMSVGTIPILSYQDWFFPHLEHKKNAIIYSGKEDLVKKAKDVLTMPKEEILGMRRNVIKYYDDYLSGKDFIKRFESHNSEINTIIFQPRFIAKENEEIDSQSIFQDIRNQLNNNVNMVSSIEV